MTNKPKKYIFDFNVISAFYDKSHPNHLLIYKKICSTNFDGKPCVSILTLFELEYSYSNCSDDNKKVKIRNTINEVTKNFKIINLSLPESSEFGNIKSSLKSNTNTKPENMKKHNIDVMLACTAIYNSCILVSGDTIFNKISKINPDFNFENWL